MQTKKINLEVFFNFVKGTEGQLSLSEARARDIFIKPLAELTQSFFEDREKIYKEFCLKNEDGTPALIDGDKYEFSPEDLEQINKELNILANEEVEINTYAISKAILEKSEYKLKVGEADIIDEILAKI